MNDLMSNTKGSSTNPTEPSTHQVRLLVRREVAESTMAFSFERPAGFSFKAGQFIDLMLLNPPETDPEGNIRAFTIASAPSEDHLMVVTRLRDTAFKRVLSGMPLGTTVSIEGPFGNLTLPDKASRPIVFLAGGIGITPFRSMLVEAANQNFPHRLVLFFSNRCPEDAPFLDELQELQAKNGNYTCVGTMTKPEKSHFPWSGETGHLNHDMLTRHLTGIDSPIYFVVGPPTMVKALRTMLVAAGGPPTDIRTEEFSGY